MERQDWWAPVEGPSRLRRYDISERSKLLAHDARSGESGIQADDAMVVARSAVTEEERCSSMSSLANRKIQVLVFVGYYSPGFKAGGAPRTVANIVEALSGEFDFWIVTRDRDLGDAKPYASVTTNEWTRIGEARINYVSPVRRSTRSMARLIASTPHDIIYLNSFFDSQFSIQPLVACRLFRASGKPIVLAPRGEFSPGALALKKIKKFTFIALARMLNLYARVSFHASSEREADEILSALPVSRARIRVAMDIAVIGQGGGPGVSNRGASTSPDVLRVIFLSRISPKKNLDYAIRTLGAVSANVLFDIYGPREDEGYWADCQRLIERLPPNVMVNYCGAVEPGKVAEVFSKYDLFIFPTRGENYGHVVAECLAAGTPVLLSDQTPWASLEADGLGWSFPLDSPQQFSKTIDGLARVSQSTRAQQRSRIRQSAIDRLSDPEILDANRRLFESAARDRG